MLPSNSCDQNVKLRYRNAVTARPRTTIVQVTAAGGQQRQQKSNRNSALSQEKYFGERCGRQNSDFFSNSNLSSDELECYMTHRRQTASESSDESPANETALIPNCEYEKKSTINSVTTMRPSNPQRQTSISEMNDEAGPTCSKTRTFKLSVEIAIRVFLYFSFIEMERMTPFKRIIHPEEVWLYKNPVSKEYVPASVILVGVISAPLVLIIGSFLLSRDRKDFSQASYAFTLALGLNGFVTSLIKISVGRPRPDFYYRCYPDGILRNNFEHCTGDPMVVNEGRKSFPSGHSSMAFAGFGFMFFYLAAKLHIFNDRGRGVTWRLCTSIAPLIVATEVAISRTCDYRHHWQDVVIGSLIGICISYLCYRQYFPSIFSRNCHRSYPRSARITTNQVNCFVPSEGSEELDENQPLIGGEKDNKWI